MAIAPHALVPAAPAKPPPTPLQRAQMMEKHIDAWVKGQGAGWPGGEVPIGEHGAPHLDDAVLAELVKLYQAAGWTKATTISTEPASLHEIVDGKPVELEAKRLRRDGAGGWMYGADNGTEYAVEPGNGRWVLEERPHASGVVLVLAR